MSSIVCSNLSFFWPDDTPLFTDLSFTVGDGRTGLVAPNGVGKSTLLKLIAGEYRLTSGSVTVDGTVGYLPQTLPFVVERSVANVLGVAPVLDALKALDAGVAGEDVSRRSATTGISRTALARNSTVSAWPTSPLNDGLARCPVAKWCRSGWPLSC
jgi:ATPase subunit of ABC transporter with duplicated ATPase domains